MDIQLPGCVLGAEVHVGEHLQPAGVREQPAEDHAEDGAHDERHLGAEIGASPACRVDHPRCIPMHVADQQVELRECNPE